MSLTDAQVRQAKPKQKVYYIADDEGLSLRVEPTGKKQWSYRYTIAQTEKRRRIKLGDFPELSLKAARLARDEYKDSISPSSKITRLLFKHVAQDWLDFKIKNSLHDYPRAGAIQLAKICLEKDLLPSLGEHTFTDIKRLDLVQTIRKIEARNVKEPVKKACSYLNQLFDYAVAMGYCDYNLAIGLNKILFTQKVKVHYPFLEEKDLPDFFIKLEKVKAHPIIKKAILFKIYTGVRASELLQAEPQHFDLENKIWKIPAQHVKQFRRKVLLGIDIPDYIIPLSEQAFTVLQSVLEWSVDEKYVFSSPKIQHKSLHFNTMNTVIRRMGYDKTQLSSHGLRSTLSTILNESGLFQSTWIEAQLSHTDKDQVRASYNHAQYIPQRREMMQWWADHLDQKMPIPYAK